MFQPKQTAQTKQTTSIFKQQLSILKQHYLYSNSIHLYAKQHSYSQAPLPLLHTAMPAGPGYEPWPA
jgi:hypothetical protein